MKNISFGIPVSTLNSKLFDCGYVTVENGYYVPPIDFDDLYSLLFIGSYHAPMLHFKKNMTCLWYKTTSFLDFDTLEKAALDFVVLANCYFKVHRNGFGKVVRLSYLPALSMRKSIKPNVYVQLTENNQELIEFEAGEVIHLKEYSVNQDIYGIPQYIGGIQSILLNHESSLFRRRFYENGGHIGYILVSNDANISQDTAKKIQEVLSTSKGRTLTSMYINIPKSSSKEPIKVIPINNKTVKDEFYKIKEITESELCACHRIPASLAAIMPNSKGSFLSIKKQLKLYHTLEVPALQQVFIRINDFIRREVIQFDSFDKGF